MRKALRSMLGHLDLIAIVIASLAAIVLHLLGMLPEGFVITFILILLAAHTMQDVIRGEEIRKDVRRLANYVSAPQTEVELIKPQDLLLRTEEFALLNRGDEWWFNVCATMFHSQDLFDKLLRLSIDNPRTTKIVFVLRPAMKGVWEEHVRPKIDRCKGKKKVQPVIWSDIEESISFRMIDVGVGKEAKEALLTFWGEPFMMEHGVGEEKAHMPRYVLHVKSHSELLPRLKDIFAKHRLRKQPGNTSSSDGR